MNRRRFLKTLAAVPAAAAVPMALRASVPSGMAMMANYPWPATGIVTVMAPYNAELTRQWAMRMAILNEMIDCGLIARGPSVTL